ncbi:hypothetical protein PM10SUCC1_21910 [Propionigenium maris DSM 9537]|uniref:ABC transporter domain-containing protein n=1 Tax=Propionigenium maris DSM 9537 TaxID=1123000 RepID=A0A9W6GLW8_9FUSO|nr:ABC transporter ATP-binding protein [Propionigenium maris]GLI56677.1 hypothetical protein PM10SUCC1_21910 [Propionigenium maris DSM 9537]
MAGVSLIKTEKMYSNGFTAVKGLDLEIDQGEFMVLIGPSGCGKTTILRMISGLEEPTRGEIWIGKRRVNKLAPKKREISLVSQNHELYPHMTIYENIAFPLKMKGISKDEIEGRVKEFSEKLGIEGILSEKPKGVTGEERQLAAIGKALVTGAKVVLFDDPLSNLDVRVRGRVGTRIKVLHQELKESGQGVTMIYATQERFEAMKMGDRICFLDQGNIVQLDTPSNLYNYPLSGSTEDLVNFSTERL